MGSLGVPHGVPCGVPLGSLRYPLWGPMGVCYGLLRGSPLVWPLSVMENPYYPSSCTKYIPYKHIKTSSIFHLGGIRNGAASSHDQLTNSFCLIILPDDNFWLLEKLNLSIILSHVAVSMPAVWCQDLQVSLPTPQPLLMSTSFFLWLSLSTLPFPTLWPITGSCHVGPNTI